MSTSVQSAPVQPVLSPTPMDRPRPASFIPSTPVIPPQSLQPTTPQPTPEAQPEVEYE